MREPFLRTSLKAYGTMDKREFERYPVEVPVTIKCPLALEKSSALPLKSVNISAGGIFLSGRPDLEGKQLSLEIELPPDYSGTAGKMTVIKTAGSIIRSTPDGFAVKFNKDLDIRLQSGTVISQ